MILLNKLLAKVDLALIKRSRISKAEKEVREVKTLRKELQQARKEAHEAGLLSQEAQKASMSLEQRLLSLPLLRPAGFPPHTTQIALILYAKDLDKVTEVMAGQPQCRLEHIALVDAGPDSPPRIPFTDKDGDRAVPVGKLETLKQHPQLEFVFYQPPFSAKEYPQSIPAYLKGIAALHRIGIREGFWIVSLPTGWVPLYLPHHYITWKKQFTELHAMLEDTESKNTLAQILKARTTGNMGYYEISAYPEYFHPEVVVRPGDVVFDAGAYGAYPTTSFAQLVGAQGCVFAFEPDPAAYAQASQIVSALTNVTLLPLGLWHKAEALSFQQLENGGSRACIGGHGENIQVKMETLDRIMEQYRLDKLDFLKMDIEGAEIGALKGAVETLRKYRPNLAICLYHNDGKDLLEIPEFIKKLNLGYKMYVGHHSVIRLDTILYATTR